MGSPKRQVQLGRKSVKLRTLLVREPTKAGVSSWAQSRAGVFTDGEAGGARLLQVWGTPGEVLALGLAPSGTESLISVEGQVALSYDWVAQDNKLHLPSLDICMQM